jgi:hydroxypyruvate isomerase
MMGMTDHGLPYLANCSMLFTEQPAAGPSAAARDAGFDAIEFWWPWPDQPVPGDADVAAFVAAVQDAGVSAGRPELLRRRPGRPDCGVPVRSRTGPQQFRDNIDVAVGIGEQLGVRAFNALYGNRVDGAAPEQRTSSPCEQLRLAPTPRPASGDGPGGTVSGPKPFPPADRRRRVAVVEAVRAGGRSSIGPSCATCSTWPTTAMTYPPAIRCLRRPGAHAAGPGLSAAGASRAPAS